MRLKSLILISSVSCSVVAADEVSVPPTDLSPFPVVVSVAVDHSAIGFDQPVSALRQDARVDLQSRGGPERQSDVSVRGGIFENTGFRLGALNLFDPQTGHYFTEIPLDPAFLHGPRLLLGGANTLLGFNSSVATVQFGFAPVLPGGEIQGGYGTHEHRHGRIVAGHGINDYWSVQTALAAARGNGSTSGGDYDFERLSLRVQRLTGNAQTDYFLGYMDKFYGWPGMYTGVPQLHETDHYQLTLVGVNHLQTMNNGGFWQAGAFARRLVDDYQFNRSSPNQFFQHETQVYSAQGNGTLPVSDTTSLQWSALLMQDRIRHSTSLVHGHFDRRRYHSGGLAIASEVMRDDRGATRVNAGLNVDHTNRDGSRVSPWTRLEWLSSQRVAEWVIYAEWAQSSQVPGYTALNSNPNQGLFRGNPDLGEERARTHEVGLVWTRGAKSLSLAGFHRRDRALVDWTFDSATPGTRQANAVDIDVNGIELQTSVIAENARIEFSYAWLSKSADYGSAAVDASYYAMNFARHRATLSATWQPAAGWELQVDASARRQQANALRPGGRNDFLLNAGLQWQPQGNGSWQLGVVGENLTRSGHEYFPGAVAAGRQITAQIGYRW